MRTRSRALIISPLHTKSILFRPQQAQTLSIDTATSWDICMWPPSSQPATRTADNAHLTPAHCSAAAVVAAATVPITQRRGGRLPRSKRLPLRRAMPVPAPPSPASCPSRQRFHGSNWTHRDQRDTLPSSTTGSNKSCFK